MNVASSDPVVNAGHARAWIRIEGALLGISLTWLVGTAGSRIGATWALGALDLVPLALVIGGIVGWVSAVRAVATAHPWRVAVGAALRAVVLGTVALALASAAIGFAARPSPVDLGTLIWLPFIALYGLVFAFPITLPIALVSVATLRRGMSRRKAPVLVIAFALVGSGALWLAGSAPPDQDTGGSFAQGPVELEWTVANRSTEHLVLFVGDPEDGDRSWGGWTQDLPGCFFSTGRAREASDWYLAMATAAEAYDFDSAFPPPPTGALVSAADLPGGRAAVWIDIAPDGMRTVTLNRAAPSLDEQTLDLCGEIQP